MKDEELEEIRKKSQGLSWRDAQAIQEAVPGVDLVAARLQIEPYKVLSATAKTKATVYGVSSRQAEISRLRLSEGRFFDALDERDPRPGVRRSVPACAATCSATAPRSGSDLKVNDVWLTVVGVLQDEGGASAFQGVQLGATAREIYLPVTTASRKFDRPPLKAPLDELIVRLDAEADPRVDVERRADAGRSHPRRRRGLRARRPGGAARAEPRARSACSASSWGASPASRSSSAGSAS